MGLQLGVVGRWARFTLYVGGGSENTLAVEVRSEKGDYGCTRITGRGTSTGASSASELESRVRFHLIYVVCMAALDFIIPSYEHNDATYRRFLQGLTKFYFPSG